jgi:hypothetical protein
MNKRNTLLLSLIFSSLLISLSACAYINKEEDGEPKGACPVPPKALGEEDLIGTWVADYANGNIDKIIIKDDGTYKQIFSSTASDLSFESSWQKWWIEQKDHGYLYLHLEGMKRCDDLETICKYPNGGLNPDHDRAIDYCDNLSITMENQIILIVTGTQYYVALLQALCGLAPSLMWLSSKPYVACLQTLRGFSP